MAFAVSTKMPSPVLVMPPGPVMPLSSVMVWPLVSKRAVCWRMTGWRTVALPTVFDVVMFPVARSVPPENTRVGIWEAWERLPMVPAAARTPSSRVVAPKWAALPVMRRVPGPVFTILP